MAEASILMDTVRHAVGRPRLRVSRRSGVIIALVAVLVTLSPSGLRTTSLSATVVAPSSYSVPGGATIVSSSAQLVAALNAGPKPIVLADGTYGSSSYFDDWNSISLYAQHLGGAVLTAGLMVGGNRGPGGAIVQGLAFNVTDPSATFQNSELNLWGATGENTQVLDTTFDGNWDIGVGLLAMNPDGLVAQRLQFSSFVDDAIRASNNAAVSYGSPTAVINAISDISVAGVSNSTPGSSGGTAEAGLWIGQPVTNGVRRIKIRDCAWSGIETVNNAWNTTYSDLDIDMSGPHAGIGVAVYLEHYSLNDTFTNFVITGSKEGFNGEWNDGTPGKEAAHHDTIENGTIDASGWTGGGNTVGVYLDQGSDSNTITGIIFKNQNWAAIGLFQNTGTNTITNNTYQLAPGARELVRDSSRN